MIAVTIDNRLTVRKSQLPIGHEAMIKQRLTVANGEKAAARKRQQWGWQDLPDSFALYEDDGPNLVMPRGFAYELRVGLETSGVEVRWDDQTSAPPVPLLELPQKAPTLEPDQERACRALLVHRQGVLQAPTGCVDGATVLRFNRAGKGFKRDIADAYRRFHGIGSKPWDRSIPTYCRALVDGVFRQHLVEDIVYSGPKPTIVFTTESGKQVCCTREHRVLTDKGWVNAGELEVGSHVTCNGHPVEACVECGADDRPLSRGTKYYKSRYPGTCPSCRGKLQYSGERKQVIKDADGYLQEIAPHHPRANRHGRVYQHILVSEAVLGRPIRRDEHVHHKNERKDDNWPDNLEVLTPAKHHEVHRGFLKMDGGVGARGGQIVFIPKREKVVSIEDGGIRETYDLVMQDPHNNFVANGVVVHNSGKTVLVLEAWRRAGLRGLILVEKGALLAQWRERALEHLGVETGMIGEGMWDERPLTIAMMQTLYRREIGEAWWRRWGFTVLDEAHHARADTYQDLLRQARSRMLAGVTATPLDGMWEQPFLTLTIGPIFHITTDDELRRSGRRVTPLIRRVRTNWRWHPANKREADLVDTKTIYRYVIKSLEHSLARIGTIALKIIEQPASCSQLVLARKLNYLEAIETALRYGGYEGDIHYYRGKRHGDDHARVAELAAEGGCVILATVADEGTDIPRLDRLHLVWPQRQELTLKQQVGRVLRTHPDKRETVVFDYVDEDPMLASQALARMRVYTKSGYVVEEERAVQRSLT